MLIRTCTTPKAIEFAARIFPPANYDEYHYDHRNRLTQELFKDSGGSTTRTVEYTYDAFDRLIYESSQLTGFPGASQFLIYDGQQAVLVTDSAGDVEHRLLWGPQVDQALADDNPVSGDVYWNLTDQQNTVRDLVEYFGSYDVEDQEHNVFTAFGKLRSSSGSADDFNDGYTGRFDDSFTGLQWNGARWYDPNDGRWLTEDPIGFAGGDSNLYRYVGNSPTNATDPSGEFAFVAGGIAGLIYFFWPSPANAPKPGDGVCPADPHGGLVPAR